MFSIDKLQIYTATREIQNIWHFWKWGFLDLFKYNKCIYMIVILSFIVIDSKPNDSENNLNIHSLPGSLECLSNLFFFF